VSSPPPPQVAFWSISLVQGILLVDLGILSIVLPLIFSIPFAITIGCLLLASGIGRLVTTFGGDQTGFWCALFSAAVEVAFGFALLGWPIAPLMSRSFLLMLFFFLDGAAHIMFALHHQHAQSGRWQWLLATGVVDVILSAMTLVSDDSPTMLTLLVSTSLLLGGASMIVMAVNAHSAMSRWLNQ
jgi:uncharacterized membrane protein HdeD (DUF308 family)